MLQQITRQIIVTETGIREAHSEPCQGTKMERFAKIVDDFQMLTIVAKRSILDVSQGFDYASEYYIALRKWNLKRWSILQK